MVLLNRRDRARLRDLITSYSGLGDAIQSDEALERAVAQRLEAHGLGDLAEYWPIVQRGFNGEMNSLVQLLTNKETFFFREMHQFEVLSTRVLPQLLAARKFRNGTELLSGVARPGRDARLRLWSAGCSTGEEPYSLAITLLEFQRQHGRVEAEVMATDIDAHALQVAKVGRYGERSMRLVPDEWRQRYFSFDGSTYQVLPHVAELVRFEVHNLADDCCPEMLSDLDVIFCRYVTIYFDDQARDRLNARLAGSLRNGGYLFVASAETMGHNRGRLTLLSEGNTFLFRKGLSDGHPLLSSPQMAALIQAPSEAPVQRPPVPQRIVHPGPQVEADAPREPASYLRLAMDAFQRQDYGRALQELDRLPKEDRSAWIEASCLRAAVLLQQERLDEAETACQYVLARDPWYTEAHFLMGLIFYHQGQAEEAIQSLNTVVYLQPEHREAHFYLAEVFQAIGLLDRARREYKNTLNILAHRPEQTPGLNLSGLNDAMLRQASDSNLNKLHPQPNRFRLGETGHEV